MKTLLFTALFGFSFLINNAFAQKLPTRISYRQNESTINVAKFEYDAQGRIKTVLDSANGRPELKYALSYDNEDRIMEIIVSRADGQSDEKTNGFIGVYYFGDVAVRKDFRGTDYNRTEQPKEIFYKFDNNKRLIEERFVGARNEYTYSGGDLSSITSYHNGELIFTNQSPYASPFKNVRGNYAVIHSMLTDNAITYIVNIAVKGVSNYAITSAVEKGGKDRPEVIKITASAKDSPQSKAALMTIEYGK